MMLRRPTALQRSRQHKNNKPTTNPTPGRILLNSLSREQRDRYVMVSPPPTHTHTTATATNRRRAAASPRALARVTTDYATDYTDLRAGSDVCGKQKAR